MAVRIMSRTMATDDACAIRRASRSFGADLRPGSMVGVTARKGRAMPPVAKIAYAAATSAGVACTAPSAMEGNTRDGACPDAACHNAAMRSNPAHDATLTAATLRDSA